MWSLSPTFKDKVNRCWALYIAGGKIFKLVGKLNKLKGVFLQLNMEKFHDIERQLDMAWEKLITFRQNYRQTP